MQRRVVQSATGGVGRAAIAGIVAHPQLELVGCWVHDDKGGRDAGELAGIEQIGVEAACQEGGTTLHGTGIHPGGITEKFPLMVSALSSRVTHVRAEEFSDIRSYDAPFVVGEIMLFGRTPEEAADSPMPALLTDGFSQSIEMVAAGLGLDLDGPPEVEHTSAVATRPIPDTPIGTIEPGQVAAQRFVWTARVGGTPVVTVRVDWLMGQEHLDPAWTFGAEGERFEVEVTGDPTSRVTFHGWHPETIESGRRRNPGIVATANHCVSSIPVVCDAGPGIRTYLDLPLVTGRAAAHLLR